MFTPAELAARWKVHLQTVYRWIREKRLAGSHMGRKYAWRIPLSEVERFERAK